MSRMRVADMSATPNSLGSQPQRVQPISASSRVLLARCPDDAVHPKGHPKKKTPVGAADGGRDRRFWGLGAEPPFFRER
jgi:hypothetical protein